MATPPGKVTRRRIYRVDDVMALMGVSKPFAYKLMQRVNAEMEAQGYITVSGRVSADYFDKRIGLV